MTLQIIVKLLHNNRKWNTLKGTTIFYHTNKQKKIFFFCEVRCEWA